MRQALHIFAKDVRLYWIEIAATLTVTALFVWIYSMGWGDSPHRLPLWPWVPGAITGLVPVGWMVLITRVIHAESLVGERQFWITRPYRWPELIGAKALFVAAFVYVPFFVAQCMLLREAGMHPFSYLPGLLFNLLLTTGILVLPIACLAAVTSNFAKMLLGLLCVILFVAGVGYLSTFLPSSSTTNSFGDALGFIVPVSVFIVVLFLQYAQRATLVSRTLLFALAVTLSVLTLFGPEDTAMGITYPVRAEGAGPQITFRQIASKDSGSDSDDSAGRELSLVFPVSITGIAAETAVKVDNARVRITAAGGERWTSHWQGVSLTSLPGQPNSTVTLQINRAFYGRMKDKPVTVELSLAFTLLQSGEVKRMVLPEKSFQLPSGSVCRSTGESSGLSCLSPMRQPPLLLVATRLSKQDCSAAPPANDGDPAFDWVGTLDSEPAEFGLTSVWDTYISFWRFSSARDSKRQYFCPGAPLSFAPYTVSSRRQQRIVSQVPNLKSLLMPSLAQMTYIEH